MRLSIRLQLILGLSFFILVTLAGSLLITRRLVSQEYENNLIKTNDIIAQSISIDVSQFLYNTGVVNKILSDYPDLDDETPQRRSEILSEIHHRYPYIDIMSVLNAQGDLVAYFSRTEQDHAAYMLWLKTILQKKIVKDKYIYMTMSVPLVTFIHPIKRDGKIDGYAVVSVQANQISNIINQSNLINEREACIIDSQGGVILSSGAVNSGEVCNFNTLKRRIFARDKRNHLQIKDNRFVYRDEALNISNSFYRTIQRALHGNSIISEYIGENGDKFICVSRQINLPGDDSGDNWTILIIQKYSVVTNFMYDIFRHLLWGMTAILIFAVVFVIVYSYNLTRPLYDLILATHRIREGAFDVCISMRRKDEIGILAENFNKMVNYLEELLESLKKKEKEISFFAYHDSLTGLYNREYFNKNLQERLQTATKNGSKMALLFTDLDNFKYINDTYGHSMGDKTLIEVGASLVRTVGECGAAYRLGGDEFIVVANVEDDATALHLAANTLKALNVHLPTEDGEIIVSGSVGMAIYPEDGQETDELLHKADTAMYYAKNSGRNQWRSYSQIIDKI